jgi:hypothetical protein
MTYAILSPERGIPGALHAALDQQAAWSRRQAMPAGGVIIADTPTVLTAMFGPQHPARPATLRLLQAWTRRRTFQAWARSTLRMRPAFRAQLLADVAAETARIRAAICEIRSLRHAA